MHMKPGKPTHVTKILGAELSQDRSSPLFATSVPAGFPSPADDYVEGPLDLNQHLIKHPAATFFVRVKGESMIAAGIHDGDILIVDRSLEPQDGSIVIAALDGELTVKRIRLSAGTLVLVAENEDYAPQPVEGETDFQVWGVVIHAIHSF
jgi:DNA polymerase V